jgi:hypothetical protein
MILNLPSNHWIDVVPNKLKKNPFRPATYLTLWTYKVFLLLQKGTQVLTNLKQCLTHRLLVFDSWAFFNGRCLVGLKNRPPLSSRHRWVNVPYVGSAHTTRINDTDGLLLASNMSKELACMCLLEIFFLKYYEIYMWIRRLYIKKISVISPKSFEVEITTEVRKRNAAYGHCPIESPKALYSLKWQAFTLCGYNLFMKTSGCLRLVLTEQRHTCSRREKVTSSSTVLWRL